MVFNNSFSILMVIISLELTRVNPDRNIFSINVELTSTLFTLQRFGPSPNFKIAINNFLDKSYFKFLSLEDFLENFSENAQNIWWMCIHCKTIYLQEELARKRELPVPPLPKRSGVWAKSNEDLQGNIFYFLFYKKHWKKFRFWRKKISFWKKILFEKFKF